MQYKHIAPTKEMRGCTLNKNTSWLNDDYVRVSSLFDDNNRVGNNNRHTCFRLDFP